jgi:hypothetical protein
LLIGAIFAIGYPNCKLSEQIPVKRRLALDIMGVSGLLGIIIMIWKTNEYQSYIYIGGLAIFSILSAIVIVNLAHPASHLAKLLGCKPLSWIGVRSYSLYLWHYPVIILTSPTVNTGEPDSWRIIFQVSVTFFLTELSWKFVEDPIRHMALTQLRRNMSIPVRSIIKKSLTLILIVILFLQFAYSSTLINGEDSSPTNLPATDEQVQTATPAEDIDKLPPKTTEPVEPSSDGPEQLPDNQGPAANLPIRKDKIGKGITAVGDSIILDAAPFLEKLLPGIIIDGKVGRQMSQAQEAVDHLEAEGKLGNRVIIELGSNGAFSTKQLRQLLTSLEDMQRIILVNTRVPKKWQDTVNSDLEKVASEFSNVIIVDWFSESKGKDSFFYDDGVHLKPEGASYYASIIAKAVRE